VAEECSDLARPAVEVVAIIVKIGIPSVDLGTRWIFFLRRHDEGQQHDSDGEELTHGLLLPVVISADRYRSGKKAL